MQRSETWPASRPGRKGQASGWVSATAPSLPAWARKSTRDIVVESGNENRVTILRDTAHSEMAEVNSTYYMFNVIK